MVRDRDVAVWCLALVSSLLGLWVSGCGDGGVVGPPELHPGLDECAHCRMIISEPRFAAVARSAGAREARFDDVGCAEAFFADPANTSESWEIWLHSYDGENWIPADRAMLVHDPNLTTPMGHGLMAFGDRDGARLRTSESQGTTMRRFGQ